VKLDYALIKPEDLEAKISPDEAEIRAAYERTRRNTRCPNGAWCATRLWT